MDTSSSTSGVSASETSADAESTTGPGPCSEVHEGDLTFGSCTDDCAPPTYVSDSESVRNIRRITGSLRIAGSELVDLSAFECLEEVGIALRIHANPNLKSLQGLERLSVVAGFESPFSPGIDIYDNAVLESLAGLDSLRELGSLFVSSNASLTSISVDQLERVEVLNLGGCSARVGLGSNPALTAIDGFPSLQSVGLVTINGQENLTSISHLAQLAENGVEFESAAFRFNQNLDVAAIDAFMAAAGTSGEVCGNLGDEVTCFCRGGG